VTQARPRKSAPVPAMRRGSPDHGEIERGASKLVLDFEGGDGDGVITYPIERAYACHVRGVERLGVYFRRRSNPTWRQELDAFVSSLDDLDQS
jgi:hypothetical protein